MRAIGVSHTACKDEFSTKSSISQLECIFIFYNISGKKNISIIWQNANVAVENCPVDPNNIQAGESPTYIFHDRGSSDI